MSRTARSTLFHPAPAGHGAPGDGASRNPPEPRPGNGERHPPGAAGEARLLVLNALRRGGPGTRARLRDDTALSAAGLGAALEGLQRDELVIESARAGLPAGGAGRPANLFALNPGGRFAVGVKIMENRVEAVLTDLATTVLAQASEAMPDVKPESVVRATVAVTERLISGAGVPRAKLVGIGLAMPGIIDSRSGVAVHVPPFEWTQVPLGRLLEEKLGRRAWLDNNSNTFAVAQHLFGHGRGLSDLVAVTIGRGIGAGLIVNNAIVRGRDGGAGEIGHTKLVFPAGSAEPRPCYCGKAGCLEAYAGEPALRRELLAAHPGYAGQDDPLLSAVRDANPTALDLCRQAGRLIGVSLGNLVNLLNPQLVVIAGEGIRLGPAVLEPLQAELRRAVFNGLGTGLPVIVDAWGDDAWGRGAASLAVQSVFSP